MKLVLWAVTDARHSCAPLGGVAGCGAHPASYSVGIWVLSPWVNGPGRAVIH